MTLYLAGSALKMKVLLKIVQQDTEEVLDPLYNRDKIYDHPIMIVDIDRKENEDLNHRARHIIQLTKEWIKRLFKLDLISQTIVFQSTTYPVKGR